MKLNYLVLIVFLFCACNNKKGHEYIYDQELYVNVLGDLYFAEQVVRNHNTRKDSVRNALRTQIFEIHKIADTTAFMSELTTLMEDSDYYIAIHDSIIKNFDKIDQNFHDKNRK